ncbi:MAG: sensor histidine kinase [Lachnospiraceae bacterium]|nr:sensor histidine kinase [Lachnospiraceae bacterium]
MIYVIVLFFAGSIIGLFYMIRDRKELEVERKQLIRIINEGNDLYQRAVNENKGLKYVKHDYKKRQQIVKISKDNEDYIHLTGYKVLDIILDTKRREAGLNNINFFLSVEKLTNWRIKDGETISLFTNLLDNAMEAANKLEGEKYVNLMLKQREDKVVLEIKNSKNPEETPIELNMITTKSDYENHGYGIKIINDIVKRNNGYIRMQDNKDEFIIEIII